MQRQSSASAATATATANRQQPAPIYLNVKLARKSTANAPSTVSAQRHSVHPHHNAAKLPAPPATSSAAEPPSATDMMPAQFVAAMRTLFDIMDDRGTGYVRLSDIERRWPTDGTAPGLPHGVIDSLRRVTPASGQLSFERFCGGLKMSLMQRNRKLADATANNTSPMAEPKQRTSSTTAGAAAAAKKPQQPAALRHVTAAVTAAVRPSSRIPGVHRALSLPKLSSPTGSECSLVAEAPLSPTIAPPKPPRTALVLGNGVTNINHLDQLDKAEIR